MSNHTRNVPKSRANGDGLRTVGIVQARMGSTRLPGKVLKDLGGKPMLQRVLTRLSRAETLHDVVVATSDEQQDDVLADWCATQGWTCFRGSEADVLDRYYGAARQAGAEVVVRVTADCPLIEPTIVDRVVLLLQANSELVYTSNIIPTRTYPRGLDAEAFSFGALDEAWHEAKDEAHREHVTPFIWTQATRFPQDVVTAEHDASALRWTVDTPEDLAFAQRIYEHFGHDRFSWHEVLQVIEARPELASINAHVQQKKL